MQSALPPSTMQCCLSNLVSHILVLLFKACGSWLAIRLTICRTPQACEGQKAPRGRKPRKIQSNKKVTKNERELNGARLMVHAGDCRQFFAVFHCFFAVSRFVLPKGPCHTKKHYAVAIQYHRSNSLFVEISCEYSPRKQSVSETLS